MGCVVRYPGKTPYSVRLVKGRLPTSPHRWTITIWYTVGQPEENETGPRRMVVRVNKPTWLRDISGYIEDQLRHEASNCGGVTDIKWQAVQER